MSQADLLVTVHSGAQGVLGIIGMKALKMLQTDQLVGRSQRNPDTLESG